MSKPSYDELERTVRKLERALASAREPASARDDHLPGASAQTDHDEVVELDGVGRGITQRRQAEQTARSLGRVIDRSLAEIYTFDAETLRLVQVNRGARLNLGYSSDELQGLSALDLLTELSAEAFEDRVGPLKSGDTDVVTFTAIQRRKGGSTYPVEVHLQRLIEPSPTYCALVLDITERRKEADEKARLESQARRADKLESLGVLAGGIAHDFNNLLTGILGHADLAMLDLPGDSPVRDNLAAIDASARRAAVLAQQMLAYSGRGRFVVTRVDLRELLEEMMPQLRASLPEPAELEILASENLPAVEADAAQLQKMLTNLCTNAAEALSDGGGKITIALGVSPHAAKEPAGGNPAEAMSEGFVTVSVTDTGSGIPSENLDRVFDPFFTTKFTGRGLGLPVVLGIVRGHEGEIEVESDPRGGTTVSVYLPALGPEAPAPRVRRRIPKPAALQGKRVLLVDDEDSVRRVGTLMLARMGCSAVSAVDGVDGLEVFGDAPETFDCVVLDLTMPRMDGGECAERILAIRPDTPIVLSSGYNEEELRKRFSRIGVSAFVHKPYGVAGLAKALCVALGVAVED